MKLLLQRMVMLGLACSSFGVLGAQAPADSIDVLRSFQDATRYVAEQVLPVVVEIDTIAEVERRTMRLPLEFFDRDDENRPLLQRGLGSGIIVRRIENEVYVLTNDHVVGNAGEITVTLYDGREYRAELVGDDENRDLALVRFHTSENVPVATLGDSRNVQVGDLVFAVGNPLGFASTITSGIVSAVERNGPVGGNGPLLTNYIQTDAAINRGNSGGPLVNLNGEVVGINTWIASRSGGNIGLGFAIPINNASRVIDQIIATGGVEYSWLGVSIGDVPRDAHSLGTRRGALVSSVFAGSPADRAGIQPGDVIVALNDRAVREGDDLLNLVTALEPGDRGQIRLMRSGRAIELAVRTSRRPDSDEHVGKSWPGMSVVEVTDDLRRRFSLSPKSGDVVIGRVIADSPAAAAGFRSGDMIEAVDGTRVRSLAEFYTALNGPQDEVVLRIRRGEDQLILGLVK